MEDEDVAGGNDIHSRSDESDSDEREESQPEDEDGTGGGDIHSQSEDSDDDEREESQVEDKDGAGLISLEDLAQSDHPCQADEEFSIFHSDQVRLVTNPCDMEYNIDLDRLVILSK